VRFRTPRPVAADKLEEVFKAAPFERLLRFYSRWDEQARWLVGASSSL
jgi:hypothetical protein